MLEAHKDLLTLEPFRVKTLEGEIWRDVTGYEGVYQVSNLGRVKSFLGKSPRILKAVPHSNGYLSICLCVNKKIKGYLLHRLVAEAFISNPDNKPQVNHINGIKTDNRVENLEWATEEENTRHALSIGLTPQGERRTESKLTNEQALYIRKNPEGISQQKLAKNFGVSQSTIGRIQRGESYCIAGGEIRSKVERRLPDSIRNEIRRMYIKGSLEFGSTALSKKFKVSHKTILNVVKEGD